MTENPVTLISNDLLTSNGVAQVTIDILTRERNEARNALRLAESALASLTWTPLTERTPAEDDGNDVGDVEFSDGSDIWQAQFDDTEKATHWRRITLPAND